jgi:hypothetical protein
MTTPDQTPDTELEARELIDENLEQVSGGQRVVPKIIIGPDGKISIDPTWYSLENGGAG